MALPFPSPDEEELTPEEIEKLFNEVKEKNLQNLRKDMGDGTF